MALANIWPFSRQNIIVGNGTSTWDPDQRTAWDLVSLGPYTFPGICKITNLRRTRKFQVVKNKETHYGEVKDLNLELAQFTIENTIIKPEDYDNLLEIIQYLETKLGVNNKVPANSNNYKIDPVTGLPVVNDSVVTGTVDSLAIIHPALRARDISSCFITSISGPDPFRVGKLVTRFDCLEVRKKVQSTSKSIKPKSNLKEGSAFDDLKTDTSPSKDPALLSP